MGNFQRDTKYLLFCLGSCRIPWNPVGHTYSNVINHQAARREREHLVPMAWGGMSTVVKDGSQKETDV